LYLDKTFRRIIQYLIQLLFKLIHILFHLFDARAVKFNFTLDNTWQDFV